jgi:hypothetical protein
MFVGKQYQFGSNEPRQNFTLTYNIILVYRCFCGGLYHERISAPSSCQKRLANRYLFG